MVFNLSESNSIANNFLAEIRDSTIQTDRMRFRRNLERVAEILAYEISKGLNFEPKEIETPLGIANTNVLNPYPLIGSILRAGLPFHQGFLNYFDQSDNVFVSAYRKHHKDGTFEINLEYISCPPLDGQVLILVDPMLATGASIERTYKALQAFGTPKEFHVATCIASVYGLSHIRRTIPSAHVWTCAIDDELTAKSYIVPGLGDAGDLAFGKKMQD